MKLHLRYLAFAVLACLLLATAGCDKDKGNAGGGRGAPGTPQQVTINIAFNNCTAAGSCSCTQNQNASAVTVDPGDTVQYSFVDAANSAITFTTTGNGSPFSNVTGTNSATALSGTIPNATSGTQWNYASVTSGSKSCNNVGSLGIIMR